MEPTVQHPPVPVQSPRHQARFPREVSAALLDYIAAYNAAHAPAAISIQAVLIAAVSEYLAARFPGGKLA